MAGRLKIENPEALLPFAGSLTKTEQIVAHLLVQGMSSKQTAGMMVLSPETVKTHVRHIREKTGVMSVHALSEVVGARWGAIEAMLEVMDQLRMDESALLAMAARGADAVLEDVDEWQPTT